jgi:hypothetical protein
MRPSVTLTQKDLRRFIALRDRMIALANEMEQHANGATPRRRRRKSPAPKAPPVVVATEGRGRRRAPTVTTTD